MVHDIGRGGAEGGTEVVKIFQVRFVERVPDYFNVEGIEVRSGETISEVRGYNNFDKTRGPDELRVQTHPMASLQAPCGTIPQRW